MSDNYRENSARKRHAIVRPVPTYYPVVTQPPYTVGHMRQMYGSRCSDVVVCWSMTYASWWGDYGLFLARWPFVFRDTNQLRLPDEFTSA